MMYYQLPALGASVHYVPADYLAEPVGSNDAKGIGPFIMAYLEYEKIQ